MLILRITAAIALLASGVIISYCTVISNGSHGIDAGEVLVVRGGIRGEDNNDLVWAGNPLNYAVKISSNASQPFATYISDGVHDQLNDRLTRYGVQDMWEPFFWAEKGILLWRSDWKFGPEYLRTVPMTETPAMRALREAISPQRRALPPAPCSIITTATGPAAGGTCST